MASIWMAGSVHSDLADPSLISSPGYFAVTQKIVTSEAMDFSAECHTKVNGSITEPMSPGVRQSRMRAIPKYVTWITVAVAAASLAGCASAPPPVRSGPVLSITTTGGCPAAIPFHDVESKAQAGTTTLAPEHPERGLVCQYGQLGPHPDQPLVASAHLSARSAGHLVALLNGSPSGKGGAVVCPADSGARDILAFAYRGQNEANVSVTFSGCATVSNGHIARVTTTKLVNTLIAVTGKKPPLSPVPATATKGSSGLRVPHTRPSRRPIICAVSSFKVAVLI